jgi:hypothetical protein
VLKKSDIYFILGIYLKKGGDVVYFCTKFNIKFAKFFKYEPSLFQCTGLCLIFGIENFKRISKSHSNIRHLFQYLCIFKKWAITNSEAQNQKVLTISSFLIINVSPFVMTTIKHTQLFSRFPTEVHRTILVHTS